MLARIRKIKWTNAYVRHSVGFIKLMFVCVALIWKSMFSCISNKISLKFNPGDGVNRGQFFT